MAISFVGSATVNTGTDTSAEGPSFPTGTTDGDLVIAFVMQASNNPASSISFSWPAGWTALSPGGYVENGGAPSVGLEARYRFFQSGDSSPTITCTGALSGGWIVVLHTYRGVDSTTPIADAQSQAGAGGTGAYSTPTATGNSDDWRVAAWAAQHTSSPALTWGSYSPADTERSDTNVAATRDASMATADSAATVDATGGTSVSATPSGANDNRANLIILLKTGSLKRIAQAPIVHQFAANELRTTF